MRNKRPVRVAEPEPAKSKMTRNSGENELALAQDIIKDFKQHDLIAPFLTPVNRREVVMIESFSACLIAVQVPDYYQIIKSPMDLGTLQVQRVGSLIISSHDLIWQKNLDLGVYTTIEEFASDVKLIFSNGLYYNGIHTDVGDASKALLDHFEVGLSVLSHFTFEVDEYAQSTYNRQISKLMSAANHGKFPTRRLR